MLAAPHDKDKRPGPPSRARSSKRGSVQNATQLQVPHSSAEAPNENTESSRKRGTHDDDADVPSVDVGSLSLAQLANRSPLRSPRSSAFEHATSFPIRISPMRPRITSSASMAMRTPGKSAINIQEFSEKSRDELEQLLVAADAMIRSKERDLAAVARVGQQLLDHNNELKIQHEALATGIASKDPSARLRTPSLVLSPSLAHFVGFDNASQSQQHITPRRQYADRVFSESKDDRFSTFKSATPSSTLRQRTRDRTISSARSSISSAHSLSDLITAVPHDSRRRAEDADIETLAMQNSELSVQLEELQAEAARNEVIGNRRLRKLTKEIADLKEDFRRVIERNAELEDNMQTKSGAVPSASLRMHSSQSTTSIASSAETFHLEPWPTGVEGDDVRDLDRDATIDKAVISAEDDGEEDLTKVTPHRGVLSRDVSFSKEFQESLSLVEENAELVFRLTAKVAELEESHLELAEDRECFQLKLQSVESNLEGLRKSYEDVMWQIDANGVEWLDRKGLIEWRQSDPTTDNNPTDTDIPSQHSRADDLNTSTSSSTSFTPNRPSRLSMMTLYDDDMELERDATPHSPSTSPLSTRRWSRELRTLRSEIGGDEEMLAQDDATFEATLSAYQTTLDILEEASDGALVMRRPPVEDRQIGPIGNGEPFELLSILHGGRLGDRGQDYWPISKRARYRPAMLVRRIARTTLDVTVKVFWWLHFLVCLGFAIYSAVKKGPKQLAYSRKIVPQIKAT